MNGALPNAREAIYEKLIEAAQAEMETTAECIQILETLGTLRARHRVLRAKRIELEQRLRECVRGVPR
jgi:hypothetical protein